MKYFGLTDKGISRGDNQDTFDIKEVPSKGCLIVALCDGMGGQSSGNIASELSKRSFVDYVLAKLTSRVNKYPDPEQTIICGSIEANSVVFQYSTFTEEYKGMGSTLVGAIIYDDGRVYIVNVGDSRAYHIEPEFDEISQITEDHSLVQMWVKAGIISPEDARSHKKKNVIIKAIGAEDLLMPDTYDIKLARGDSLLFCSDGVSNLIEDRELLDLSYEYPNPEDLCVRIKEVVYSRGAHDNLTVIVVKR